MIVIKILKNWQLLTIVNTIKSSQKDRSQYEYNYFSWTACYNNACSIYYNNKNELKWYLKVL